MTDINAMDKEGKKIYRSRIDWWLWAMILLATGAVIAACIGVQQWYFQWDFMLVMALLAALFLVTIRGTWYAIEGGTLIVYQFFRPTRMPVVKIREVRYVRGFLAGPALSTRRIAIRFRDRSVTRSAIPVEISPRDREAFVSQLLAINPGITVIQG